MKTFVVSVVHWISKTQWMNKIKYTEINIFLITWKSDLLFLLRCCCWESGSFRVVAPCGLAICCKVSGNKPPLPPGLWVNTPWGAKAIFFLSEVSEAVTPVQGATDQKTCYLNMKRVWNDKIFQRLVIFVAYSGNLAATRAISFAAMFFSPSLSLCLCQSLYLTFKRAL